MVTCNDLYLILNTHPNILQLPVPAERRERDQRNSHLTEEGTGNNIPFLMLIVHTHTHYLHSTVLYTYMARITNSSLPIRTYYYDQ